MPFPDASTNPKTPHHPRNPWERDAKSTARRRYAIVAIAALLATVFFLYAVDDAKRRAAEEATNVELARLQTVSLEAAWQIEAFFDKYFAMLNDFSAGLLAVSDDVEAADRLAGALVENNEAALSAAFAVGNVYGTAEQTDDGVVVSRDLSRTRGDAAQWVSDAYEKPSDELDRYIGRMLGAIMNPSPYGSLYATMPPPTPLMAAEISVSFDKEGLAWLELSLREVEDICDKLRGAYYTAPLLLTHDGTSALPGQEDERAATEVSIMLEVYPERQRGITGDEHEMLHIYAVNDVRIGNTDQTWRIAFYSDRDSALYRMRDKHDRIRIVGLFVIAMIALAAAVLIKTREIATRPKTAEPNAPSSDFRADPVFMERTKGLRRQRFACRLLCALFFIPALLFIAKREKAFEKAAAERNIEGMQAAVAGMWPPAIIGLLLGLAILWANFTL